MKIGSLSPQFVWHFPACKIEKRVKDTSATLSGEISYFNLADVLTC
jgi:hypothetical protein